MSIQTSPPPPPRFAKPLTIILWLIIFFPVGLWLLWRDPRPALLLKQIVTGVIALIIVANGIASLTPAGRAAQAAQDKQAKADAATAQQQAKADALAAIPEPQRRFPALAKFPEVTKLVDKETNDDPPLPKLRSFKYDRGISCVCVEINMDQNLTTRMANNGAKMEAADLYRAILHDGNIKPNLAEVRVFGPLEDKFGHTTEDLVLGTAMERVTADQINWGADKADLETSVVPGLWTAYYNFKSSF